MDLDAMIVIVRQDLRDEEVATYDWTDDELTRHIGHSVKDFSLAHPLPTQATLATVAGSRELDISSLVDRVYVEAVEYPVGLVPPAKQPFTVWGDTLTFLGEDIPDGADCSVYYGLAYTLDSEGSDVPAEFEDLIATGASGYALLAMAGSASRRINIGGIYAAADILKTAQEKLVEFRTVLRRHSRQGQIRVRQLYNPYYLVPLNQSMDPGP